MRVLASCLFKIDKYEYPENSALYAIINNCVSRESGKGRKERESVVPKPESGSEDSSASTVVILLEARGGVS